MTGAKEIWLSLGAISIPLVPVSGFLLGIVFIRRVQNTQTPLSEMASIPNENETDAYYVRTSSTVRRRSRAL